MIVFGVTLLRQVGMVTGGIAGIALLISYATGYSVTTVLLVVNVPFFVLAARSVSLAFGIKSLLANIAISGLGLVFSDWIRVADIDPTFAAFFGGSIIGIGILMLARHGAGVGGVGIVALMLQKSKGWNAGRLQMMADGCILAVSMLVVGSSMLLLSIFSAACINGVLMVNHREGRYIGY